MVDVDIRIRETEAQDEQPLLLWDTVWNEDEQALDWTVAPANEPQNAFGLQARKMLDTAILIQLATWRRAEPYDNLPSGTDPKGWWGDTVDLEDGEVPLGSKLWLLYRSPLTDDVAARAKVYVLDALTPILKQGAAVRFDIETAADKVQGKLIVAISGYSEDGQKVYDQKFTRLWQQEFS